MQVERVIYSRIIKSVSDLTLIYPYLIEDIDKHVTSVIPSVVIESQEDYSYIDSNSCKKALKKALDDTISHNMKLVDFLRFLRRIYIVSGIAEDDRQVYDRLKVLYEVAMYIDKNKQEE